jgi:hypothetical protein
MTQETISKGGSNDAPTCLTSARSLAVCSR